MAFVAIGSNQDDPPRQVGRAITALQNLPGTALLGWHDLPDGDGTARWCYVIRDHGSVTWMQDGDAGDPGDPAAYRAELIAAGRERIRRFRWSTAAEQTLDLLEEAAGS